MYPRRDVLEIAHELMADLAPVCERANIAGSVRRGKEVVKDLEIVAMPVLGRDLFGQVTLEAPNGLDEVLGRLVRAGRLERAAKNGPRYKQFIVPPLGIKLDLFLVLPPAEYGVQLVIRTGPAAFSRRFVTRRAWGGLLPSHLKVHAGAIWDDGRALPLPDEASVFELLGIEWIEPENRR